VTRPGFDDIEQGEILWIKPELCSLADLPQGFALRVDEFLGWDYDSPGQRQVWVRGAVLRRGGGILRSLVLCVPVDQPRVTRPPSAAPVEPARGAGGGLADGEAGHREERMLVERAGRLYRRVEFAGDRVVHPECGTRVTGGPGSTTTPLREGA
jgi:hypothetical protein